VAWGLDLVNYLAVEQGLLDRAEYDLIHAFVKKYYAHKLPQPVSAEELINATRRDKKVSDGKVNLIMLRRLGKLEIVPTAYDAKLEKSVAEHLAAQTILSWPA
jgi:3-dehydroquinate synthetase